MVWVIPDAVEYRCRDDRVCLVFVSHNHHRFVTYSLTYIITRIALFSLTVLFLQTFCNFNQILGEAQPCLFINRISGRLLVTLFCVVSKPVRVDPCH